MDRQVVYIGAIPQDTDLLNTNKNVMIGLGYLMQAVLGTSTLVDGLACTPTSPAGMTVNVATGSIYSLDEIDATAYGSIEADTTDSIVKQGIVIGTTNFSCPAPVTTGQSVVYLVEAAYQDLDSGSTVLPYYNASNPSVAWSGPNNTGVSQNTVRQGVCSLQLKTGVAATTGTQTTPSPDAGYTGLFAITVANGQSTIISGNIAQLATAPFITPKLSAILPTIQGGTTNSAHDTSGSANTITIALSPIPASLTDGMVVRVKVANSTTGATVMNTNGLGNVSVVTPAGSATGPGTFVANGVYDLTYDANGTRWIYDGYGNNAGAVTNFFIAGTSTGSANAQVIASTTPSTGFSLSNNGQTVGFTAGYTNTGSTTLAFTSPSISATTIKKDGGSGLTNLTGGEIIAGNNYFVTVNTTSSCFVLEAGIPTSLFLQASNNLSDLPSPSTALSNLGALSSATAASTYLTQSSAASTYETQSAAASTYAPLASPAFTGTPTVPTATLNTNTTQAASMAALHAAVTPNFYQGTPSNPTGTTSTVGVMMGLGAAAALTPTTSGKVQIIISGSTINSSGSDGSQFQIRYGTGTAPSNGAALTGTAGGGLVQGAIDGSTLPTPFSLNAIVSGLTLGTAIWMDVSLAAISGGTASVENLSITAHELH